MRRLDRYILRLIVGPFLFFVLVFTGVVWLTQSLRIIDTIVNAGQPAMLFLELTALLLPRVFAVILPLAAFAGTLFGINRLYTDSEIVVMLSSGMNGLALFRPVLLFAFAVAVLTWANTLYGIPTANRELRDRIAEVRGDIAAAFLREGTFLNPGDDVTIYIREMGRPGELLGVFVHDERKVERAVTYTAERAVLLQEEDATRLVMFDGMAQVAGERPEVGLQVLRFDQFAYDLSSFEDEAVARTRKPSEMYLPTLLTIDDEEAQTYGRRLGDFRAEAHEALSSPLYAIALPMMAVAFVISMGFRRQGFAGRIVGAVVAALVLRLIGMVFKGMVTASPALWPLVYLPPLVGMALAVWMITATGRGTTGAKRRQTA